MKNSVTVLLLCLFLCAAQGAALAAQPLTLKDFDGTWTADYEKSSVSYLDADKPIENFTVIINSGDNTLTMIVGEDEETGTVENVQSVGGLLKFSMDGYSLVLQKDGPDSMAIIDQDEIFVFRRAE